MSRLKIVVRLMLSDTTICLPTVFEKIRQNRLRSRIILYQDNASSHNAEETTQFLVTAHVQLMTHPPYSFDLVLCDFFLFPYIKDKMRGSKFNTPCGSGGVRKSDV